MMPREDRVVRVLSVLAVALPLVFNPFTRGEPFATVKALLLALAAASLVVTSARPLRDLVQTPLAVAALLYAAAYTLATACSVDLRASLGHPASPTFTVPAAVAIFVIAVPALQSAPAIDRIGDALAVGSVPVALYGLVQGAGLDPIDWRTDSISPVLSTVGRSNSLGAYLGLLVPLSIARVLSGRDRRARITHGAVLALQSTALLATLARGPLLGGLAGALVTLALIAYRRRRRALLAAAALLVVMGAGAFTMMSGFGRHEARAAGGEPGWVERRSASVAARLVIWEESLRLARERPALGYGPDTFASVFMPRYPPALRRLGPEVPIDDPHNLFLDHLMDAGLIGLGALLAVIAAFYATTLGALARDVDGGTTARHAGVVGAATAFLVQAQFGRGEVVPHAVFWVVLALGAARARISSPGDPPARPRCSHPSSPGGR
jgi:O-antigen ligase